MQQNIIRWQFDMTWSLLDSYLDELTDADCFWLPSTSGVLDCRSK